MIERRTSASVVLAMTATLLSVALATPAGASTESDFVALVNRERTSRGLNAERVASDVGAAARRHAARMAAAGRIWHNPNLGSDVSNWEEVGENVGRGRSVGKIHAAFMESSSHRANILAPRDNVIGVGVAKGSDGRIYVTEIFVRRKDPSSRSASAPRPRLAPTVESTAPRPRRPQPPRTQAVDVLVRLIHFD